MKHLTSPDWVAGTELQTPPNFSSNLDSGAITMPLARQRALYGSFVTTAIDETVAPSSNPDHPSFVETLGN